MEAVFLRLLNMSLSAAAVITLVILARLCLRRAPKKWSYLLWAAPAFRLVCPVSFRAFFSIFRLRPPTSGNAPTAGLTYISGPAADPVILRGTGVTVFSPGVVRANTAAVQSAGGSLLRIAAILWGLGVALLVLYAAVSRQITKDRLRDAVRLDGNVYETDRIDAPFLLGLWRPRIYLPAGLSGERLRYVLSHERVHLRRRDHWIKLLAFLLLTVHWFNPLVWLAFFLLSRDMEMSCDEKVLAEEGNDAGEYSRSLLSFAAPRQFPPGPLAFGEPEVKRRIINALRWKRPRTWVTLGAILLVAAVTAACAANPPRGVAVRRMIRGNMKTYYEMSDGTWRWEDHAYKYRLKVSGRLNNIAWDSTFVYLSNRPITFEQAWNAAGHSPNDKDYFSPAEAVLVEVRNGEDAVVTSQPLPTEEDREALSSLLAKLRPKDISYILAYGFPVLTPELLAPALNRAADHILRLEPEPEDLFLPWEAVLFLSGGPEWFSSTDEHLGIQAGLTENEILLLYLDGKGGSVGVWAEDESLYRLLRDPSRWEGSIDPLAWEKYGSLLENRAQADVENYVPYPENMSRFTGYEITWLEKTDYRYREDGRSYEVYAWAVAFLPEDPFRVAWAGSMNLDNELRVVNYEMNTYFAVCEAEGGIYARFLGWDSFLQGDELNADLMEPVTAGQDVYRQQNRLRTGIGSFGEEEP